MNFWVALDINKDAPRLFEFQQDPASTSGYFVHLRPNALGSDEILEILNFFDDDVRDSITDDVLSYYL